LERLDGVEKARVSLGKKKGWVSYDPARVMVEDMISAINKVGFKAELLKKEGSPSAK
jgi:copper chaperone CopZ